MRRRLWFGFAATMLVGLALSEGIDAQAEKKGPPFGKKGFGRGVTAEQIVERIMSFDKNEDGKITIDELPERMQHLLALGDTNKDGALDRNEITKLATTLEAFTNLTGGAAPPGPPGAPPKGPPGKGPGPKGGAFKGPVGEVQRTLDEMNVTGATREKADRLLRTQQDKLRRFEELQRAEIVMQMKDVLEDEDYRVLKAALDRPPGPPAFKGPRSPDLNARIDQLQKELETLRGKLPK
jgi:hypothetical protein